MILTLSEIYSQGNATASKRWHAVNFFDRIILCNSNDEILSYDGDTVEVLAGLPEDETLWDGAVSFFSHLVLWRGNVLKWSDLNDCRNWIPVGLTSGTGVVRSILSTLQPAPNGLVDITVDSTPTNWVEGTFVTATVGGKINYYSVAGVSEYTGQSAQTINLDFTAPAGDTVLWLAEAPDFKEDASIKVSGTSFTFTVKSLATKTGVLGALAHNFSMPAIGATVVAQFVSLPATVDVGDYISFAPSPSLFATTGQDIYQVIARNNNDLTIKRMGVGTNQINHVAGDNAIFQPAINVYSQQTCVVQNRSTIVDNFIVSLKAEPLSGASQQGSVIPLGTEFLPLTANEAGESRGSGGADSGQIMNAIQLGDKLYVFGKRLIQSYQYVGRPTIFEKRDEISSEGLSGKYLITKVGNDEAYFWGAKDLYRLAGGQLTPVAQAVSKQVLEEFDPAKLDEYLMYHNELNKEIWTIYRPKGAASTGSCKVLIYNYISDSCVFDEYPADLGGICAVGGLTINNERHTIVGVSNNQITSVGDSFLVHGKIDGEPIRDILGRPIPTEAVTAELDFGDASSWKYIDTLMIDLEVKEKLASKPSRLWVEFGGRESLDSDTVWTGGQYIDVSGAGNRRTTVNQRVSGRFISLRFRSEQAGLFWKIASFNLSGRMGGTY